MFSGKSEELIRRLQLAIIARKMVQVFTPAIDTRYSESEIVTHAAARMRSEALNSADEILAKLHWRTEVIGIDEANFFGAELVGIANSLAQDGKQVIVAGLDSDFLGRPFAPMQPHRPRPELALPRRRVRTVPTQAQRRAAFHRAAVRRHDLPKST